MHAYQPIAGSVDQNLWFHIKQVRCLYVGFLVLKHFLIDERIYKLFVKACGCSYLSIKLMAYAVSILSGILIFLITDQKIICSILDTYIDNCIHIDPAYCYFIMICLAIQRFFKSIQEAIDEFDGTAEKEREKAEKEIEKAEREIEKRQWQESFQQAAKERREMLDKIESLKAQNAELSGNNNESLAEFRKRVAQEQRRQIITIFNNSLTDALDQYDGISLRFDPLRIDRNYDSSE